MQIFLFDSNRIPVLYRIFFCPAMFDSKSNYNIKLTFQNVDRRYEFNKESAILSFSNN